jgi:hypothetical protein
MQSIFVAGVTGAVPASLAAAGWAMTKLIGGRPPMDRADRDTAAEHTHQPSF